MCIIIALRAILVVGDTHCFLSLHTSEGQDEYEKDGFIVDDIDDEEEQDEEEERAESDEERQKKKKRKKKLILYPLNYFPHCLRLNFVFFL